MKRVFATRGRDCVRLLVRSPEPDVTVAELLPSEALQLAAELVKAAAPKLTVDGCPDDEPGGAG